MQKEILEFFHEFLMLLKHATYCDDVDNENKRCKDAFSVTKDIELTFKYFVYNSRI